MKRFLQSAILIAFHLVMVRPVVYWFAGVRYRKRGPLPKGPCLVVANHNSHLDTAILMSLFPLRRLPRVHPVAAADYFGGHWFKRMMAMLLMNGIPIERRPKPGVDPLGPITRALEAGDSLIFFPEGSRGEAGVVAKFRPGVGRLVRAMPGLRVVPVFLSGPERIWPRGQLVPVPLNTDAIVGRARGYDPELDARDIAEQVQRDVLALAPPPPPPPAPRPSPPLRVAVCSLDPELRTELFREVAGRLGRCAPTLGIGDPMLESDGDGVREVTGPIPYARGRAWLAPLAWLFRVGGRTRGDLFTRMIDRAQINEAAGQDRKARFLVSDGSSLVDLVSWAEADFYAGRFDDAETHRLMEYLSGERRIALSKWWRFIRKAREVWLVNTFDLARPPVPDVLVLVDRAVEGHLAQLRRRGDELQAHHQREFLERLHRSYREVAEVLRRRRKIEVLDIDAEACTPQEAAEAVERVCLDHVAAGAELGPASPA